MARQATRLDRGLVGLAMLAGASMSMGFIQLLAGPLEQVANLSVQVLALQTTAMAAPLVVSLLLLLREGQPWWPWDRDSPNAPRRGCCVAGASRPCG